MMAQPVNQQQISWQIHPPPSSVEVFHPPTSAQYYTRGAKGRLITGGLIIFSSVLLVVFAIILICLPFSKYPYEGDLYDYVSYGIWHGVFALITGCFGVYSKRSRCLTITYMVTTIIVAVSSAGGCIWTASVASWDSYSLEQNRINYNYSYQRGCANPYDHYWDSYNYNSDSFNRYNYYDYRRYHYSCPTNPDDYFGDVHIALYITSCVIFALQIVVAIIGACFTCGVCTRTTRQQRQQMVCFSCPPNPYPQCDINPTTGAAPINQPPMQQFIIAAPGYPGHTALNGFTPHIIQPSSVSSIVTPGSPPPYSAAVLSNPNSGNI